MQELTADEAPRDFGRLKAESGPAPVRATAGRKAAVVLSADAFGPFRPSREADVAYAMSLLDEVGGPVAAQGLTDEVLAVILADES